MAALDLHRSSQRHCSACGAALVETSSQPLRLTCNECGKTTYLSPKVGVALVIQKGNEILLAERADEPLQGWWTLPAGYVEYCESCEDAAIREAKEELSVEVVLTGLHGVYSYGDDPRSRMVLVVYNAKCDCSRIVANDDVSKCQFFKASELPGEIAFQGNRDAIALWSRTVTG